MSEASSKTVKAYLGLGSNIEPRASYIYQALGRLAKTEGIQLGKFSSLYETKPQSFFEQPDFLNAACEITTTLSPQELLAACQAVEKKLGRRQDVFWGPRLIDIDILLYADQIIADDNLTVPHCLLTERAFVLVPLKEIAPEARHPVLNLTISAILAGLPNSTAGVCAWQPDKKNEQDSWQEFLG